MSVADTDAVIWIIVLDGLNRKGITSSASLLPIRQAGLVLSDELYLQLEIKLLIYGP